MSQSLHERIADVLGWPVVAVQALPLPALKELVRHFSPELAAELSLEIARRLSGLSKESKSAS